MFMATMCACPPLQNALPHCKYVLHCCSNLPRIALPGQESDRHNSNTYPPIRIHVYHVISCCKLQGRLPLDETKMCCFCSQNLDSLTPTKVYTRKEFVMMEISIAHKFIHPRNTKYSVSVNLTLSENHPVHPCVLIKSERIHTHKTVRTYTDNT